MIARAPDLLERFAKVCVKGIDLALWVTTGRPFRHPR